MIDFYELLGISMDSTKQEIKSAYREMVKKYHPDINDSEEANKIIRSLNEAKEVLLDDEKRKEYDSLLNEMKYSKQFSKEKEETYKAKAEEYKETYSDVYITKWQFLMNYLRNGIDKVWIKGIKLLFVILNLFIFIIIKGISLGFIFLFHLISGFVDYFAGLIMILAVLSLFVLAGESNPDYIPWIPANVENFGMLSIVALVIELLKLVILKGSLNLYAFIQNIEDKIFITILMK